VKRVIVSDPCDEVEHIEQIVYGMENLHLICEGVYYGQNLTRPITKSVKKEVDARLEEIKVIPLYKPKEEKKTKWQIVKSILSVRRLMRQYLKKR
jgi:hypothetical protein